MLIKLEIGSSGGIHRTRGYLWRGRRLILALWKEMGSGLASQAAAVQLLISRGPACLVSKGAHLLQGAIDVAIWICQWRIPVYRHFHMFP